MPLYQTFIQSAITEQKGGKIKGSVVFLELFFLKWEKRGTIIVYGEDIVAGVCLLVCRHTIAILKAGVVTIVSRISEATALISTAFGCS